MRRTVALFLALCTLTACVPDDNPTTPPRVERNNPNPPVGPSKDATITVFTSAPYMRIHVRVVDQIDPSHSEQFGPTTIAAGGSRDAYTQTVTYTPGADIALDVRASIDFMRGEAFVLWCRITQGRRHLSPEQRVYVKNHTDKADVHCHWDHSPER